MNRPVKQKSKFRLVLNSHSLSQFQRCEQLYDYATNQSLEKEEEYYPFKRGGAVGKILEIWYLAQKKGYSRERLTVLERKLYSRMLKSSYFYNKKYKEDDAPHISGRLLGYFKKYREDPMIKNVISVEAGFSKIIYEDSNVQFVYEGRPDLIVDFGPELGIGPIDHKTESREGKIYEFNNQFLGYCWAIGANFGLVNFIGLQKHDKENEVLRRKSFYFSNEQLDQWRKDTIRWYFRAMRSIVSNDFLRSWQCDGKYSVCQFNCICESARTQEKLYHIKRDYVQVEPYSSW